ncbi:Aste57867_10279 [Aphanomyces stellatus]|uniref:Aste57867_10279 protein n=1 Tax=Aphanomyces stellatus TaxID=120398 RepID=A0A485KPX5_9STRA|nr:hypothetical protein As57867_010239 [Aphanomyces stellatus]VFT87153.1 Aste57867_10279 [Aphanomyces stellatus]
MEGAPLLQSTALPQIYGHLGDLEESKQHLTDDGYSWDYVLVFPSPAKPENPDEVLVTIDEILHTLHLPIQLLKVKKPSSTVEDVCCRLKAAGLNMKLFSAASNSTQHSNIFCLVRAPPALLAREADRIDLNMLMDKDALRAIALTGYPSQGIAPFPIEDTLHQYALSPYECIYFKYSVRDDMQDLYVKQGPNGTLFTSTQRMLLTESIMANPNGGAGLDLSKMDDSNVVASHFPLHDNAEKDALAAVWLRWLYWPSQQPMTAIQSYFGSKIGLYFAFLGHYTSWLIVAGSLGVVLQILYMTVPATGNAVLVVSSTFIVIWAALLLKSAKRNAATLAMQWGTSNARLLEKPRPQFKGQQIPSPITGRPILYFDKHERHRRMWVSGLILFGLTCMVVALVAAIYYMQYHLIQEKYSIEILGAEVLIAGPVTAIANVVQIAIMGQIYESVCIQMNDFENHATETSHEGAFILKSVIFYLVNNLAAVFYITFIKSYIGDKCAGNDCLGELRTSVLTIFITSLIAGNLQEVLVPRLMSWWTAHEAGRLGELHAASLHPIEHQFYLIDYGWMGTFNDYLEMVVQFCFTVLFIGAFPAAPVLSLVNNYFEIRIDGYKLLTKFRRPPPRQAATSGQWITVLEILVTLAIATNGFVLVYSANVLGLGKESDDSLWKLRAFCVYSGTLLVFRYGISSWFPNVPDAVSAQLKRQEFLTAKIYNRESDNAVSGRDEHVAPAQFKNVPVRQLGFRDSAMSRPKKPIVYENVVFPSLPGRPFRVELHLDWSSNDIASMAIALQDQHDDIWDGRHKVVQREGSTSSDVVANLLSTLQGLAAAGTNLPGHALVNVLPASDSKSLRLCLDMQGNELFLDLSPRVPDASITAKLAHFKSEVAELECEAHLVSTGRIGEVAPTNLHPPSLPAPANVPTLNSVAPPSPTSPKLLPASPLVPTNSTPLVPPASLVSPRLWYLRLAALIAFTLAFGFYIGKTYVIQTAIVRVTFASAKWSAPQVILIRLNNAPQLVSILPVASGPLLENAPTVQSDNETVLSWCWGTIRSWFGTATQN